MAAEAVVADAVVVIKSSLFGRRSHAALRGCLRQSKACRRTFDPSVWAFAFGPDPGTRRSTPRDAVARGCRLYDSAAEPITNDESSLTITPLGDHGRCQS